MSRTLAELESAALLFGAPRHRQGAGSSLQEEARNDRLTDQVRRSSNLVEHRGFLCGNSWIIRSDQLPSQAVDGFHLDPAHQLARDCIDRLLRIARSHPELRPCQMIETKRCPYDADGEPYLQLTSEQETEQGSDLLVWTYSAKLVEEACGKTGDWLLWSQELEVFYFPTDRERPIASAYVEIAMPEPGS